MDGAMMFERYRTVLHRCRMLGMKWLVWPQQSRVLDFAFSFLFFSFSFSFLMKDGDGDGDGDEKSIE